MYSEIKEKLPFEVESKMFIDESNKHIQSVKSSSLYLEFHQPTERYLSTVIYLNSFDYKTFSICVCLVQNMLTYSMCS